MKNSAPSGSACETSGDFPEELSLEQRLAASVYLNDLGITGTVEEMCVRLTVELAQARQANKDLADTATNEANRLGLRAEKFRNLWMSERTTCSDALADVERLEELVKMTKFEAASYQESFDTCQQRLHNALSTVDELATSIDWDSFND